MFSRLGDFIMKAIFTFYLIGFEWLIVRHSPQPESLFRSLFGQLILILYFTPFFTVPINFFFNILIELDYLSSASVLRNSKI